MDDTVRHDFVERATAFLDANAVRRPIANNEFVWGKGDDSLRLMGPAHEGDEGEALAAASAWRAKAFDAGLAWAGGPKEYGGGGLDPELNDVWRELESEYLVPDQSSWGVAWDMVGPAVAVHGSEDLRRRFLGPIYRGDLLCSQLLSEPEAGSDLAGLKTRAVRDGDEWIVNGQKVWNSMAHRAQIGQLMARTDPDVPKHQGLTMFLLPLDTPGVEIRPLKQMNGQAEFNEVFLTDVRVPDANRVGEPGSGWRAVLTTLMSERASVGASKEAASASPASMLVELARHLERTDDPIVRQQLADVWIYDMVNRLDGPAPRRRARAQRARARRRGLDPQADRHPPERADRRRRRAPARPVVHRRHGGVGDVQLVELPDQRTGPAHRRRHRRDPAEHPR